MIKNLFFTVACIFSLNTSAQNLVTNGDFEVYSALPNSWSQLELASGWSNLNQGTGSLPFASPDYLHTMGSNPASLPNSYFGTVNPYSGNAIAGFITYNSAVANFREYISTELSSPMQIDSTYTISFWLSNGTGNWYGRSSSDHIGIRFSTQPLVQSEDEPVGGTPQIELTGQTWSTAWQNYSFTFTADQNYRYFTLGNFYDDASTTTVVQAATGLSLMAYYFVDKIEVYNPSTLPVLLKNFNAVVVDKTVVLDWTMQQEINSKEFVVEHSTDLISFNSIGKRNGAGNSDQLTSYTLTHYSPSQGMNYYRLKMIDVDGKYNYSVVRKVRVAPTDISLRIMPNPVGESFNVEINSRVTGAGRLVIYDLSGRAVFNKPLDLKKGVNDVPVTVTGLSRGEYILQVTADDAIQSIKLIRR